MERLSNYWLGIRALRMSGLVSAWALVLAIPATAGIDGHWEGAFNRQGAIQTVSFDFQHTDARWIGTYDIPASVVSRKSVK